MRLVLLLVFCLYLASTDASSVPLTLESMMERLSEMELRFHQQAIDLEETKTKLKETETVMKNQESELVRMKQSSPRSLESEELMAAFRAELKEQERRLNAIEINRQAVNSNATQSPSIYGNKSVTPTGCGDLQKAGHGAHGFYPIKSSLGNNKIDLVYCNFWQSSASPSFQQTRIGTIDVKSASSGVHFYVQKNKPLSTVNSIIPFEVERLNVGGAMNTKTGIFTAPVSGTYHFAFSGLKELTAVSLYVIIQLNNVNVGGTYTGETGAPPYTKWQAVSLASTLVLKKGDMIQLILGKGMLHDDINTYTHFTGWLIEEDLILP